MVMAVNDAILVSVYVDLLSETLSYKQQVKYAEQLKELNFGWDIERVNNGNYR